MRRFRVRFDSRLADSLVAAVPRQGRGGRCRGQTVDLAAHVRGFAGAAGSTISPIGFSGTTEMSEIIYRCFSRARDYERSSEIKCIIYPQSHSIAYLRDKIRIEREKTII